MIAAASSVAQYRIDALIGSGGMGDIYRATDTRLGRAVALKVLPDELTRSRDRVRRFLQEAKAASSLNHPNIVTVYDAGEAEVAADGNGSSQRVHFIATELITGDTLHELIHRQHVPLRRLLDYLGQAADGVAKAHAAGIVHRDLKPDNIMVTADGFAKVVDFGLVKLMEAEPQQSTVPERTRDGMIMGTVAYMSPEQAQGRPVDHRSDIFSFGAILYEAAARKAPFASRSDPEVLHRIVHEEPAPPSGIPRELDRLIARAMTKDPEQRIQSMKDVALELRDISQSYDSLKIGTVRRRSAVRRGGWIAATIAALLLGVAGGALWNRGEPQSEEPIRFAIAAPQGQRFSELPNSATALQFSVSPDGRSIAFVASVTGARSRVWVRDLAAIESREIAGTEGASLPFWSPRSDEIAFFADGKLKRVAVRGGAPPVVLADASDPRGGSWASGTILFAPTIRGPLMRIADRGGDVVPATSLDEAKGDLANRWPHFLPDGRRFLFLLVGDVPRRGIYATSLDGGEPIRLIEGAESNAMYVEPDEILYVRHGSLWRQRVDVSVRKTIGESVLMEQRIGYAAAVHYGAFAAHDHDLLAFASRVPANRRLVWRDRSGNDLGSVSEAADWGTTAISVRGDKAVVTRADAVTAKLQVWLVDLARGAAAPLAPDDSNQNLPVLAPDGSAVAFLSNRSGSGDIRVKSLHGGAERVLLTRTSARLNDWTPDGRFIIYTERRPETKSDLWMIAADGSAPPQLLMRTPFDEMDSRISPDGRWIAYSSDVSGREEVYVEPFPGGGERYQVSAEGGTQPLWSKDQSELYFVTPANDIAAARVTSRGTSFACSVPAVLFRMPGLLLPRPTFLTAYAVGDDGRFLMSYTPEGNEPSSIRTVVNWR